MFGVDSVTRSLHVHWAGAFAACPTVHPGQEIDTAGPTAWVELWVEAWDEQLRRNVSQERMALAVTAQCFSRHLSETAEVRRAVDAARAALAMQLVEIRDYDQSGAPLLGFARLREAEVRDLTRMHDDGSRGGLRHLVVFCRGIAEEV